MALSLLPLAIAALCILLSLSLYRRLRVKLPPGPRPWPVVGNLYDIKPVRFRCYAEWAEKYGPIMSVWLGTSLNVIVSSSELAREVLRDYDQQLADRTRTRSSARFSRGGKDLIWADYGPHYVKVRKVCTLELLSAKRLEALRPIREDEVTAMVEAILRDCPPDTIGKSLILRNYIGGVSLNNITRLVFGKRFVSSDGAIDEQGSEFKAIVADGTKIAASLSPANYVRWLRWLFPEDEKAFEQQSARRDRLTRAIMEEYTRNRQEGDCGAKQHFVDALLTLQDKYDLSEDTVITLLWDMIAAGMDTTVISTEWAMAEVVRNPRVQERVQEELDRVVGTDRVMTEADFPNLPYLHCVVKEGLRMHPPTPLMLPHRASSDVKVGGYDVPKGTTVAVNVWAIARDPRVWKDPLEFRPERFLEEDVDMKGHDFRLLPFGAGRRVCPGAQLGISLVQSMLGHLLHHFKWTLPVGLKAEDIDMSENPGAITFMHTPLRAVATPRLAPRLYKRHAVDM